MKKIMLGTAIALLSASTAFAQDYQAEVGVGYVNGDIGGVDYDGFGLKAEVHLDRVDTSKGPLNEAAFLDKSSFVGLSWLTAEADLPGAESEDTLSLEGRFVTAGNIIIEAGYSDFENDEALSFGVGMYLNDTMDAVLRYETYDEADESTLGVGVHGVNKLEGTTSLAYDLGIAYLDVNDENGYELSVGADYYLDQALSFGAALSLASVDDVDVSTFELGVNYFVTPVVSVGADFITLGQDGDGDSIALNANMRF